MRAGGRTRTRTRAYGRVTLGCVLCRAKPAIPDTNRRHSGTAAWGSAETSEESSGVGSPVSYACTRAGPGLHQEYTKSAPPGGGTNLMTGGQLQCIAGSGNATLLTIPRS